MIGPVLGGLHELGDQRPAPARVTHPQTRLRGAALGRLVRELHRCGTARGKGPGVGAAAEEAGFSSRLAWAHPSPPGASRTPEVGAGLPPVTPCPAPLWPQLGPWGQRRVRPRPCV